MNERRSPPSGATAHLDAEDLAVLLEENLPEEKAARLRQHIAGCEDCYELFVTSAEAFEEMEPPADHGGRFRPAAEPPRWLRPLAFAAMAALAVITGFLVYRQLDPPAGFAVAQAIEQLEDEDAQLIETPSSALRGAGGDDQLQLAFGLGVESIHLALQQRAGDSAAAAKTLDRLRDLWRQLGVEEIPSPFENGPEVAMERFEEVRRRNTEKFYFDPVFCDLGLWTEASRLAAAGGHEEYFQSAMYRNTLEDLGRQPELESDLQRLPGKQTLEQLQAAFQAIRDRYDPDR
jgi:hypothetical protein